MKKGLIIFDIDGTIVDSPWQKLPSQKMIESFKKVSRHYYISPATGRPWSFAKDIIESLGIIDPCIVAGWTQICSSTGQVLWQADITKDSLKQALDILGTYEKHSLLFNDYAEDDYLQDRWIKSHEIDRDKPIYFLESIFVPDGDSEVLQANIAAIEGIACSMVVAQRWGTRDLHITRDDATKEFAIARLLDILSIDKSNTIGIWDGYNDIHLFAAVEKKIAMWNAVPELKKHADLIIGTVHEDAVADFFHSLSSS